MNIDQDIKYLQNSLGNQTDILLIKPLNAVCVCQSQSLNLFVPRPTSKHSVLCIFTLGNPVLKQEYITFDTTS